MPLFEFRCNKCGREFEDLVSANANARCPECGCEDTQKLMSTCVRHGRDDSYGYAARSGGGCGGCSGGNCASCGH